MRGPADGMRQRKGARQITRPRLSIDAAAIGEDRRMKPRDIAQESAEREDDGAEPAAKDFAEGEEKRLGRVAYRLGARRNRGVQEEDQERGDDQRGDTVKDTLRQGAFRPARLLGRQGGEFASYEGP